MEGIEENGTADQTIEETYCGSTHNGHDGKLIDKKANEIGSVNSFGGSVVSNAAAPFFPKGWSVSHDGTGIYTVTHTLGTSKYSVVVSPNVFATRFAIISSKTGSTFEVVTFAWSSGSAIDTDFDFCVQI